MNAMNNTRSKRWNRRSSDGAAWGNSFDTDQFDEDDGGESEGGGERVRRCQYARCWRRFGTAIASEPLFSREPMQHMTGEFKDRLAAASRSCAVSFVILSVLIFSGQGEGVQ